MTERDSPRRGLWCAIGAYGLWGLIPLYFDQVRSVPASEILAHRVFWSFVVLAVLAIVLGRWGDARRALAVPRIAMTLLVSTLLIGTNWLVYIYAVTSHQTLQASLGYFITPLVNVLLGVVWLRERLRPYQVIGLTCAAVGVLIMTAAGGQLPWIALSLATSFSFYGLLRKTVAADALLGLLVETMLLSPIALAYIVYLHSIDVATFTELDTRVRWLLMSAGIVTTIPLLLFAAGARRLRMSTMGVLQYLAPTLQFAVAVGVFHEEFHTVQAWSFACIWLAVAIYSLDSFRAYRQEKAILES